MRRAVSALTAVVSLALANANADARPATQAVIYKADHAATTGLGAGNLIGLILGLGVGLLVVVLVAHKRERYTSLPTPPSDPSS